MKLLERKHAVITGAGSARGLGRAAARLFSEHGALVAILDLDGEGAVAAASDLGPDHLGIRCDVTDKDACVSAVASIEKLWGGIDVLVNNAGVTQPLTLMDISSQDYELVLDVNLRGTLYMSQTVVPGMRQRKSGSIVNLSSVSAQRGGGIFGGPHYSAAKAAILGLTKAMARELAPDGIRVNAICPGFIDTDITAGKLTDAMRDSILAGIPLGRIGMPADVAGCALFLASNLSAYCTGTEIDVNGGSLIH